MWSFPQAPGERSRTDSCSYSTLPFQCKCESQPRLMAEVMKQTPGVFLPPAREHVTSALACLALLWPCPYFPLSHVCFCHLWRKSKPFMFSWPEECFDGVHALQVGIGLLKNRVKYSYWHQIYRPDYHVMHRFTMKFMSELSRRQCAHSKVTLLCGKQSIHS